MIQAAREFLLILVSVLSSFALDAWWGNSVAQRRTRNELESVKVELTQTVSDLNQLENREFIIKYLNDKMPTLAITQKTGQMGAYPATRFSVSTASIQRDISFEGMFSSGGMMIEDTRDAVLALRDETERVLQLIDMN